MGEQWREKGVLKKQQVYFARPIDDREQFFLDSFPQKFGWRIHPTAVRKWYKCLKWAYPLDLEGMSDTTVFHSCEGEGSRMRCVTDLEAMNRLRGVT